MESKKEENKTAVKETVSSSSNTTTTQQQSAQQQAPANSEAELMTSLFNFIKHPAVTAIGGYFIGKYFEAKKQEGEQEKITEKLMRQIEALKEQVKELKEERKPLGSGREEQRTKRLEEGNNKSRGIIQLD